MGDYVELDSGQAGVVTDVGWRSTLVEELAGNTFVIQSGGAKLGGKVAGTGTWDRYQQVQAGTLALEAGERTVTMRPDGKINGALIDLRGIRLVLVK